MLVDFQNFWIAQPTTLTSQQASFFHRIMQLAILSNSQFYRANFDKTAHYIHIDIICQTRKQWLTRSHSNLEQKRSQKTEEHFADKQSACRRQPWEKTLKSLGAT